MDLCLDEQNKSAWQAVSLQFLRLFKEKIMLSTNQTECSHVQTSKELTTAACSVMALAIILICFSILGSLSTAFGFIYQENIKREKLRKNTKNKNFTNKLSKTDWISNSRLFVECFCFVKNGKTFFQTDPDKKQFECFHGIRVLGQLSIVFYHTLLSFMYTKNGDFKLLFPNATTKLFFNAYFGVDAFFVLSGFLNAYSFSKTYNKSNGKIGWKSFYLKRFLRLTPAYMFVLGFYTTLLNYTGSGPIWPEYATNPVCKENWWRYLMYINNFELSAKSCMLWCWHLAAEMQVYVVSPIFLLSLLRWQKFGLILASITCILSALSSFLITKQYNLLYSSLVQFEPDINDMETLEKGFWMYVDQLYVKPYARISPYLIGVLLGYYFYCKDSRNFKNRWITLFFGWIAAGILVWISFFGLLERKESLLETALYNSVKHHFFAVGLSWIIFACLTEQGRFVNAFLSWKFFIPFSKLSYCVYLIQSVIIQRDNQASQELEEFFLLPMVFYGFRVYFWALVFSIPLSLLLEIPVINLSNFFLKNEYMDKKEERNKNIKKK